MTWRISFDIDDADVAMRVLSAALNYDIVVNPPEWVAELTDEEMVEDIGQLMDDRIARQLATYDAVIGRLERGEDPPTADPTPPHGIERPHYSGSGHSVTGSQADPIYGIESVQCSTCTAAVGEVCRTQRGVPYRRGFAHAARRRVFNTR